MTRQRKITLIISLTIITVAIAAVTVFKIVNRANSPLQPYAEKDGIPSYCYAAPKIEDPRGRDPGFDINKLPATSAVFKLASVAEKPGVRPDLNLTEQINFTVFIERPDLKLKQEACVNPDGYIYTSVSNLTAALQPKRMLYDYATAASPISTARDSGNACDYSYFPHSCVMDIKATDQPVEILLKAAFEDGTYAEQKLAIPFVGKLADPVLEEPKIRPKNNDKLALRFKDVGADSYKVKISICHLYQNNGINPCLKGWDIDLARKDGKMVLVESSPSIDGLLITGNKDAVILQSEQPIIFAAEDNSVNYNITADKNGETADSIATSVESVYNASYK